mmetsp:Transcript_1196/g.2688  ORF Transcript_1196/g.2688 Transcript_1196/m.2688 type:complete len:405 (+) Transcript_1196:3729-4943(+)
MLGELVGRATRSLLPLALARGERGEGLCAVGWASSRPTEVAMEIGESLPLGPSLSAPWAPTLLAVGVNTMLRASVVGFLETRRSALTPPLLLRARSSPESDKGDSSQIARCSGESATNFPSHNVPPLVPPSIVPSCRKRPTSASVECAMAKPGGLFVPSGVETGPRSPEWSGLNLNPSPAGPRSSSVSWSSSCAASLRYLLMPTASNCHSCSSAAISASTHASASAHTCSLACCTSACRRASSAASAAAVRCLVSRLSPRPVGAEWPRCIDRSESPTGTVFIPTSFADGEKTDEGKRRARPTPGSNGVAEALSVTLMLGVWSGSGEGSEGIRTSQEMPPGSAPISNRPCSTMRSMSLWKSRRLRSSSSTTSAQRAISSCSSQFSYSSSIDLIRLAKRIRQSLLP